MGHTLMSRSRMYRTFSRVAVRITAIGIPTSLHRSTINQAIIINNNIVSEAGDGINTKRRDGGRYTRALVVKVVT
jgi:hypothetical protein